MKILFATSEFNPLVKVGGLGDVAGSLPVALRKLGVDARVILPAYANIVPVPEFRGVPLYFIKSHKYFKNIYPGGSLESEQFAFFSEAVVDWLLTNEFTPDVIHCHDYHTATISDRLIERGINIPTLLTIHDLSNTGGADAAVLEDPNMLKRGIYSASWVSTVSPTYAKEITPLVGGREVTGILNGIDYEFFNPFKDEYLEFKLKSVKDISSWKKKCKASLQEEVNLPKNPKATIFSMITRLAERKGVSLFLDNVSRIVNNGGQVVVLGTGDISLEKRIKELVKNEKGFCGVLAFNEALAHRIYAGSDFFLVPSLFEPCGLTQMIAMRYGALPIVRNVGGLSDSVVNRKDGFVFEAYTSKALGEVLSLANNTAQSHLAKMREAAFKKDFSWNVSAKHYKKLYEKLQQSNQFQSFQTSSIIFAPLRLRRPRDNNSKAVQNVKRPRKSICLFCPGNEKLVSPEISRLNGNLGTWKVRVIPNKFPILNIHEVIITTRKHGVDFINMTWREIYDVLSVYQQRMEFYLGEQVMIYHNYGGTSGASIAHAHSQLVVLPPHIKFTQPSYEKDPKNIVKHITSRNFLVFCPENSQWGWETSICQKRGTLEFSKLKRNELEELSKVFLKTLKTIYRATGLSFEQWSYNFSIFSGMRWQIRIIPRNPKEIQAGLELGSGVEVNAVLPEFAAAELSRLSI